MSHFRVGIVGYGSNPHARCFEDFLHALVAALRTLGHEVAYAAPGARGRLIMFGANNILDLNNQIPPDAIVYNTEQLAAIADPAFFMQNHAQFRTMTVWDYAHANLAELKKLGMERAVLCPVGYVPSMTTIAPAPEEDIDVLFYGSEGGARREILAELEQSGLEVVRMFGVYGKERDEAIARAKVVLNLHYYPHGIFEIFRCSHLFANRKCVVTEGGGRDAALEALAERTCAYTPRAQLVERCRELVADANARRAQAERGFEEFRKIDLVENVRRALEAS